MNGQRWTLAAAMLFAAGCATVEENQPETAPAAPPPIAVLQPAPEAKRAPAAQAVAVAPPAAPDVARPNEVETLIAEFGRLRRLGPAELAREQEAARLAFNQSRGDSARVRFAMALAIPGAAASDDVRTLDLLDPLVKTPGASLHSLAFLLASYVQEQRRLTSQVAGLQHNVQGLQQNVHGLQQKLDAIKTLERSLSGRGETGAVRRR